MKGIAVHLFAALALAGCAASPEYDYQYVEDYKAGFFYGCTKNMQSSESELPEDLIYRACYCGAEEIGRLPAQTIREFPKDNSVENPKVGSIMSRCIEGVLNGRKYGTI